MTSTPLPDIESGAIIAELGEAGAASAGMPRRHLWGTDEDRAPDTFPGLDRMGERLAKALRLILEPFVPARPEVACEPLEHRRFGAWRSGLPPFTSLSHYHAEPLKGGFMLAIEPGFVSRMVDAYYGGTGAANPFAAPAMEFTASEERVAARLADAVAGAVAEQWAEIAHFRPLLSSREIHSDYAKLIRADDPVVIQRLPVDAGAAGSTVIELVYPLAALRAHAAKLAPRAGEDVQAGDPAWRARILEALSEVRVPVRSVLARPTLSVTELLALKPGDVIPVIFTPTVPLLVAKRPVASGTIGEQDGRAALMVEQIHCDRTLAA